MSIHDVAELAGLSWDTVKEIHKARLRRKYKSFNLKTVRHIAIDEVHLDKGKGKCRVDRLDL
jgi:transposase